MQPGFCTKMLKFAKIWHMKVLVRMLLASEANVVVISVDYRLAPEHALPGAYEDSWAAMQWISAHSNGQGPEPWLNQYADFRRIFMAGESAGVNIAHYVAVQASVKGLAGPNVIVDMAKRAGRVWVRVGSIELWVKRVTGQKRVILSGLKTGSGQSG